MGKRTRKLLDTKIDITRVNKDVISRWIRDQMNIHLPDDDIVADYILEMLYAHDDGVPNGLEICTQLVDFMGDEHAASFCGELWALLGSAQLDADGIPAQLIDARKRDDSSPRARKNIKPTLQNLLLRPKTNYNRVTQTINAGYAGHARPRASVQARAGDADIDTRRGDRVGSYARRRSRSPSRGREPRDAAHTNTSRESGGYPKGTPSRTPSRSPSRSPSRERF